jgi:hypothetical protein
MGLVGLSTGYDQGNNKANANNHLKKFSVMGGTMSATTRPSTLLPAHTKGGSSNNPAVGRSRAGLGGEGAFSAMRATLTQMRRESQAEVWRQTD